MRGTLDATLGSLLSLAQDGRFSTTICTNLLRPGRLRKCSTYQSVALSFSQPPEHQDLGTSHSPESLTLDGGLRPRCSDERRPDSYTVKPDRGALPVECPVAECARRATSPGCRSGTFRTPHVPMGRDVFRKAVGRRDRPSRAPRRKARPSGRAVFDQSAAADRRSGRNAGSADCQRGHSTGSAPRESNAEAGGSLRPAHRRDRQLIADTAKLSQ